MRAYRRCCQFQHIEYGVPSLAFLSYEAVFLYQLGLDFGLVQSTESVREPASLVNRRCCRLQASRRMLGDPDAPLALYATSFGVLLGKIKMDDDIRDGGRKSARLVNFALRKSHRRCLGFFQELDPGFQQRVTAIVDQHHQLETPGVNHPIDHYATPTAEAFGYLFELMTVAAEMSGRARQGIRDLAKFVGQQVGRAVIAFDCAVDFKRDQKSGDFNPLPNEDYIDQSLGYSARCLSSAHSAIGEFTATTNPLTSQRILSSRGRAIYRCLGQASSCFSSSKISGFPDVVHADALAMQSESPLAEKANKKPDTTSRWCDGCDCCCDAACIGINNDGQPCDCNGGGDCCSGADCCGSCDCSC